MISFQTLFLIALLVFGAVGLLIYFFTAQMKKLKEEMKNDDPTVLTEWLKEMKSSVERNTDTLERQLTDQRKTLDEQLKHQAEAMSKQTKVIWERLDNASKVIGDVQQHLGGLKEFGRDMKDLSNVLKSPKLRGGLGEQFLYEILANSLPNDLYKTQYRFKSGAICDAVVFTDKGIIPIDSKFSMENFKVMLEAETEEERVRVKKVFLRDVKMRIDEIASKYILPEEGTTEQAVMYIPSENIFYELVVNSPKVEEYAKSKDVVMASPNTLSYFLKIILVAYQQHELEAHAKDILKALSGIRVEATKFEDDLGVLAKHITHSYKSMDSVQSNFQKLFGKIESVQSLGDEKQKPLLE